MEHQLTQITEIKADVLPVTGLERIFYISGFAQFEKPITRTTAPVSTGSLTELPQPQPGVQAYQSKAATNHEHITPPAGNVLDAMPPIN